LVRRKVSHNVTQLCEYRKNQAVNREEKKKCVGERKIIKQNTKKII